MTDPSASLSYWKKRHSITGIFGILLNLAWAIPLLLWPDQLFHLFGIPFVDLNWARWGGGLVIVLCVFYAPMIVDIDRFRILAWFQILPSRGFGCLFFLGCVVIYHEPQALLIGAAIDGGIAILSLICLIRIVSLEQEIATGARP